MTSGDVTTEGSYIIILFSTYLLEKCKKFYMSAKVYISPSSRRHRQNMSRQKVVSFYNIPWPPHTRARTYGRSRRWGHRRSPPLATGGSILTGWWGIQNERFFTTTKKKCYPIWWFSFQNFYPFDERSHSGKYEIFSGGILPPAWAHGGNPGVAAAVTELVAAADACIASEVHILTQRRTGGSV